MLTLKRIAAGMAGVAAAALASNVAAVTLTNRDDRDYRITVVEGESSRELTVKPAAVLDSFCQKGCVIRLNNSEDEEYELEGNETVSIEDGLLYYDGPETLTEPDASEGGKAQAPKR